MLLLFIIGRLHDLTSSCSKLFEILHFSNSYAVSSIPKGRTYQEFEMREALLTTFLIRVIGGSCSFTWNFKIIKWKTEFDSCRSSFFPPFPNSEITGPYQFLLKTIWNPAFLNYLHRITCLKNKNIWKIWQYVSSTLPNKRHSSILQLHFKFSTYRRKGRNRFMQELLWSFWC